MKYVYQDGSPVPENHCVIPDTIEKSYIVTVRSMRHISADTIKDLIEKKFEVVTCEKLDGGIMVCQGSFPQ